MLERILQAAASHGDRAVIVPVGRLADLRRDVEALRRNNVLNGLQQQIVDGTYHLEVPDLGFPVRSIVLVATSSIAAMMTLTWRGRDIPVMIPPGYVGNVSAPALIERYLNEALAPVGRRARHALGIPKKLLAVRSGLGVYGRNNLCYVKGMGSLLNLVTLYTDVACPEGSWHEIRAMDACRDCEACLNACPTGAIMRDRFLIDNERCLTFYNEAEPEYAFPDWLSPSAHHTAYGCSRCMAACPANGTLIDRVGVEMTFTEHETGLLLRGPTPEDLPEGLRRKVDALDMAGYLGALPRNLRALGVTAE